MTVVIIKNNLEEENFDKQKKRIILKYLAMNSSTTFKQFQAAFASF